MSSISRTAARDTPTQKLLPFQGAARWERGALKYVKNSSKTC